MKKIIYIGNKEEQIIMKVGRIKKGFPKEVPDEVAKDLVDGKNYKYYIEFEPPVVINSPRYESPKVEKIEPIISPMEISIPKDFIGMVPIIEEPIFMEIITTNDDIPKEEVISETKKTKKWHKRR